MTILTRTKFSKFCVIHFQRNILVHLDLLAVNLSRSNDADLSQLCALRIFAMRVDTQTSGVTRAFPEGQNEEENGKSLTKN